ncbi:MAG TPA: hypothetical protein VJM14_00575 [Burkholderiales bacterium]|nr:hypothetical protein [Burkholderiales bacterium]
MDEHDLEELVREAFPQKADFSARDELGLKANDVKDVGFVHGGSDPLLDRQFEDWLADVTRYVSVYQLLNRLCRAGMLRPGSYCVKLRPEGNARGPRALQRGLAGLASSAV